MCYRKVNSFCPCHIMSHHVASCRHVAVGFHAVSHLHLCVRRCLSCQVFQQSSHSILRPKHVWWSRKTFGNIEQSKEPMSLSSPSWCQHVCATSPAARTVLFHLFLPGIRKLTFQSRQFRLQSQVFVDRWFTLLFERVSHIPSPWDTKDLIYAIFMLSLIPLHWNVSDNNLALAPFRFSHQRDGIYDESNECWVKPKGSGVLATYYSFCTFTQIYDVNWLNRCLLSALFLVNHVLLTWSMSPCSPHHTPCNSITHQPNLQLLTCNRLLLKFVTRCPQSGLSRPLKWQSNNRKTGSLTFDIWLKERRTKRPFYCFCRSNILRCKARQLNTRTQVENQGMKPTRSFGSEWLPYVLDLLGSSFEVLFAIREHKMVLSESTPKPYGFSSFR